MIAVPVVDVPVLDAPKTPSVMLFVVDAAGIPNWGSASLLMCKSSCSAPALR